MKQDSNLFFMTKELKTTPEVKDEKSSEVVKEGIVKETVEHVVKENVNKRKRRPVFSPKLIGAIADEVSRTLMTRLPGMIARPKIKVKKKKKTKKIDYAIFLDTSAIIDGRIFDVIYTGLMNGVVVLLPSILMELKTFYY